MKHVGPALAGVMAVALALAACSGSGSGSGSSGASSNGPVTLQLWDAQTAADHQVMMQLASEFHASHPKITIQVSTGGTSTGDLLPKVTTALASGTAPDIAYIFGSYAANIAASGKTVNLASQIHQPGFDWSDFYPASQQTVSGPDNWVIFNNGSARVNAAIEYMKWLTAPAQELKWDLVSGSLPIRPSMLHTAGYQEFLKKYPGIGPMAENLKNAKEAMPALPQWPRVVNALGTAIASVLLGRAQPKSALDQAAQQANTILNVPAGG